MLKNPKALSPVKWSNLIYQVNYKSTNSHEETLLGLDDA